MRNHPEGRSSRHQAGINQPNFTAGKVHDQHHLKGYVMKIRKVSIDALTEPAKPKALTPAQMRRAQLERDLEQAISAAKADTSSAFKLILDPGEKFPTVRLAFNRVRDRVHATEINLHKRGDDIYIAALAETRGRRRKES